MASLSLPNEANVRFSSVDSTAVSMSDSRTLGSSTSLSLLSRARANDSNAWVTLVHLYSPLIYSWIRRVGIAEHDAADIAQEVLGALPRGLHRLGSLEKKVSFRAYLGGMTRNKANDFLRKKISDRPAQLIPPEWIQEIADESNSTSEASETDRLLANRALDLIKTDFQAQTWQAFWRTAVLGQKASAVARDMSMKVGSVYTARSRVLARLRTELDGLL